MGRLIDADICLLEAWQNFYKQEEEHEKNIDDYDIMRDQFYEQSGFECCQQTIVNAPTAEAIPKDQYEARLKADMVAMLTDIQLEIEDCVDGGEGSPQFEQGVDIARCQVVDIIQQKIDALKEQTDGNDD